jgi:hypothetical protein
MRWRRRQQPKRREKNQEGLRRRPIIRAHPMYRRHQFFRLGGCMSASRAQIAAETCRMWPERITWRVACAQKFSPAGAMAKEAWSVTNRKRDRTRITPVGSAIGKWSTPAAGCGRACT